MRFCPLKDQGDQADRLGLRPLPVLACLVSRSLPGHGARLGLVAGVGIAPKTMVSPTQILGPLLRAVVLLGAVLVGSELGLFLILGLRRFAQAESSHSVGQFLLFVSRDSGSKHVKLAGVFREPNLVRQLSQLHAVQVVYLQLHVATDVGRQPAQPESLE